jgi:hypothetical protein
MIKPPIVHLTARTLIKCTAGLSTGNAPRVLLPPEWFNRSTSTKPPPKKRGRKPGSSKLNDAYRDLCSEMDRLMSLGLKRATAAKKIIEPIVTTRPANGWRPVNQESRIRGLREYHRLKWRGD